MSDTARVQSPLLRLPREVLVRILSYLLRHDQRILAKELYSPERRALNREVARLKDPHWKAPKRRPPLATILTQHSDLYLAGVIAFWGSNTFVFGDLEVLSDFLTSAHPQIAENITRLALGEDYHYDKEHLKDDGSSMIRMDAFRNWPHPDWPPSLAMLSRLPRLKCLELDVGILNMSTQVNTDARLTKYTDERRPPWAAKAGVTAPIAYYLRDHLLVSISDDTWRNLSTLRMQYMAVPGGLRREVDVMPYGTDLRCGAWRESPYWPVDAGGERDSQRAEKHRRWVEARAAVYWDHCSVPHFGRDCYVDAAGWFDLDLDERSCLENLTAQWCTWAREWDGLSKDGEGTLEPAPKPGTYEELFSDEKVNEEGEKVVARDPVWGWRR